MAKKIAAIILIYCAICAAWLILGGTTTARTHDYGSRLSAEVAGLWGEVQMQQAPQVDFLWWTTEAYTEEVTDPKTKVVHLIKKQKQVLNRKPVLVDSSNIDVDFDLEHRKKGLLWYATYGVAFDGDFAYTHQENQEGWVEVTYRFPTTRATYDDFVFEVNGEVNPQVAPGAVGNESSVSQKVRVARGDKVAFKIAYVSRGLDSWRYSFGGQVSRVKDFNLTMTTNFDAIDFPEGTISPSTKDQTGDGWKLAWNFSNLISGFDIGMEMPDKLNPGPLSAQISLFAPVTLLFFFIWMFVITLMKKIELHPINYLFLGAAFFAFHLLFAYTVDRLPLIPAFLLSSTVSVFLVVSYLRLAVGMRFAAVEAGLSQIVYLVLFSYAHFYEGWTGLIVTIGSILTLFMLMQLTGRINWNEKFAPRAVPVASPQINNDPGATSR
jgi:inner membrane protein involved in colicin E2 resistance